MPFGDGIDWFKETERVLKEKNIFYTIVEGDETAPMIKKHANGGRLLDCGCNMGRWSDFFQALGFDYTGIDQDEKVIEVARRLRPSNKYIHSFLWDFNSTEKFDVAAFVAVLQHNKHFEKEAIMEMLRRVLNQDAVIFIMESTVPENTATQYTEHGWIDLFNRYGFRCVDRWHANDQGFKDRYVFKRGI
jgi:2-polyprenyl-3-methyl-5-hydroxy-6-metoxy-1,4-benzoquinol methylase